MPCKIPLCAGVTETEDDVIPRDVIAGHVLAKHWPVLETGHTETYEKLANWIGVESSKHLIVLFRKNRL